MDKITQALRKILPAEHVAEVAKAVEDVIAERFSEMEAECQDKLNEAYEKLTEEKDAEKAEAVHGYRQAYEIISHLMNRIDEQRAEFETALEEGFDQAYAEVKAEKSKNGNIELELYDEFNKKLQEMKEIMVDKVDQFMGFQEKEIYESAIQNVLNDPAISENVVLVQKIKSLISGSDIDDVSSVSSSKIEETNRQLEDARAQLRIIESKNCNLSRVNDKLQRQVNEAHQVIGEATKVERKERVNRRGNASGRGQRVVNEQIINEYAAPTNSNSANDRNLTEGNDPLNDLLVLSGLAEIR